MGRGGVALGSITYSPGDPKRHFEHPKLLALDRILQLLLLEGNAVKGSSILLLDN